MDIMKKIGAWRVARLAAFAALVSSAFTAPASWASSFYEAYDQYGAPVRAQVYDDSWTVQSTCVANSLGIYFVRYGTIQGVPWPPMFGAGAYPESFINPSIRTCSDQCTFLTGDRPYGWWTPNKNGWGPNGESCFDTFWAVPPQPAGRVQVTQIFSGSALDSQGNRLVFDHIVDESNAGAGPCPTEVWIKGSRITVISAGTEPAMDYVPPAGCTSAGDAFVDYTKIKAIYRAVVPGPDDDNDQIPNADDNCPVLPNTLQNDLDQDGIGNECDSTNDDDFDSDGILDVADNCPRHPNADQSDIDGDEQGGDACDPDKDGDGYFNGPQASNDPPYEVSYDLIDNCPSVANPDQIDTNNDGVGDVCDADADGARDDLDNCPLIANPDQTDTDGNGRGDSCEGLPPGC
jgi:Thrombospondin type 3 repeat